MPNNMMTVMDPYAPGTELKPKKLVGSLKEWEANVRALCEKIRREAPNPKEVCVLVRKKLPKLDARYVDFTKVDANGRPHAQPDSMADACLVGTMKIATPEEEAQAKREEKEFRLAKLKKKGALAAAREAEIDLGRHELKKEIARTEAELAGETEQPAETSPPK